jgi:transposase
MKIDWLSLVDAYNERYSSNFCNERQLLKYLYVDLDMTIAEIEKLLGVSYLTLRTRLQDVGVTMRPPKWRPGHGAIIKKFLQLDPAELKSMTPHQIAEKLGTSVIYARALMKRHGLTWKNKRR